MYAGMQAMFALLAGAGFYAQKSQPVSTLDEEVSGILGDKQSSAGASFYASACPCQQCFVVSLGSRRLCGLSGPWGSMNTVPSVVHSAFARLHSRLRRLVLHTNTQGAGCRLSWRPCNLPLAHCSHILPHASVQARQPPQLVAATVTCPAMRRTEPSTSRTMQPTC